MLEIQAECAGDLTMIRTADGPARSALNTQPLAGTISMIKTS